MKLSAQPEVKFAPLNRPLRARVDMESTQWLSEEIKNFTQAAIEAAGGRMKLAQISKIHPQTITNMCGGEIVSLRVLGLIANATNTRFKILIEEI